MTTRNERESWRCRPTGGVVYKARDRDLDQDVVIKLLDPHPLSADGGTIEHFKTEIRLARQISTPHLVRTHDFGEWKGTY